jgi:hypothetical protein
MSGAQTGTGRLRELIQGLVAQGKKEISTQLLYAAAGIEDDVKAKDLMRRYVTELHKRGELQRIRPGVYTYDEKRAPKRQGEMYQRIWRAIRSQKSPGWTFTDLAQVTRSSYSMVRKYCVWLDSEGYIVRFGKKGVTSTWRTGKKAREQRETPYPPTETTDPWAKEKAAALAIVRVFLEQDPGRKRARATIVQNAQALVERFGGDGHRMSEVGGREE